MVPSIELEIDEGTEEWLRSIADQEGLTLEEAAAGQLAKLAQASGRPTWQETDVLRCLRRMDGRPGRGVPVKSIFIHWAALGGPRTNDDMFDGIDALAARRWIEPVSNEATAIVLTQAGYDATP